jgi:hypothetical protein
MHDSHRSRGRTVNSHKARHENFQVKLLLLVERVSPPNFQVKILSLVATVLLQLSFLSLLKTVGVGLYCNKHFHPKATVLVSSATFSVYHTPAPLLSTLVQSLGRPEFGFKWGWGHD